MIEGNVHESNARGNVYGTLKQFYVSNFYSSRAASEVPSSRHS